jgi:hypothetical protein
VFHVYVEGVTESGPDAVRRLADAMASRYGLPAGEVQARLSRGRFRVKANVDQATADRYARDLETIGARVRVEEALPEVGSTPSHPRDQAPPARRGVRTSPALIPRAALVSPPDPAPRPSPPLPQRDAQPSLSTVTSRPSPSTLPPQPEPRPSLSTLPPQPEPRPSLSTLPPQPEPRPSLSTLPPRPSRPVPSTLPPQPASRPTRPSLPPHLASRPSPPVLPAHVPSRATSSPLPAHLASRPLPRVLPQPGLPDADADASVVLDATGDALADGDVGLGALDRSGLLSLGTLDGDAASTPGSLEPAVPHARAHQAAPARPPPAPAPSGRAGAPVDRFAPPAVEGDELVVELADDELAHHHERAGTPPAVAPELPVRSSASAVTPDHGMQLPSLQLAPMPPLATSGPPTTPRLAAAQREAPEASPTGSTSARPPRASPRVRLAAGVLLAIVLGFIPAHVVASLREEGAFREIDAQVIEAQAAVDSLRAYEALDALRTVQLDAKRSAQRRIALASLVIWAVAGGAVAYVWFKRVPWR